ncbi:hypothetical protein RHAL1_P00048 (plasmid) [Beijerinckiaceae bacterium RH AL1]|nr:hypothetical protein RHAL1_P00048 [Beijerinckiaceae bacterium RH AL1]
MPGEIARYVGAGTLSRSCHMKSLNMICAPPYTSKPAAWADAPMGSRARRSTVLTPVEET